MTKGNIPLFKVYMSNRAPDLVSSVLRSGFIGDGEQVKALEKELSMFFDAEKTKSKLILVNSATSAEHLIYHLLKSDRIFSEGETNKDNIFWPKLEPSDEVLTTPLTCTATNWPIVLNSLNLKWVDVDSVNLNMSLEDLENKIDQRTRVVTLVHWGGNPIDIIKLESIVKKAEEEFGRPIAIIEDCAHSFGSKYSDEVNVGFRGNFSTFSLQAIKHLTSGDGGFVVTPFSLIESKAKLLRWYGIDRDGPRTDFRCEDDIEEVGFKFHMNNISAAIGRANLFETENFLPINKSNGKFYNENISGIEGITLIPEMGESAYWLYTLHVEKRDDFMRYMQENGVTTSRVHERNDKHSCMKEYIDDLPGVEKAVKSMISIPVGYWVTEEDRNYIVDLIKKGW